MPVFDIDQTSLEPIKKRKLSWKNIQNLRC